MTESKTETETNQDCFRFLTETDQNWSRPLSKIRTDQDWLRLLTHTDQYLTILWLRVFVSVGGTYFFLTETKKFWSGHAETFHDNLERKFLLCSGISSGMSRLRPILRPVSSLVLTGLNCRDLNAYYMYNLFRARIQGLVELIQQINVKR